MSETPATTTRVYEGMFLVSQSEAADLGGIVAHIQEVLDRGHAEVVAMRRWDDRRLAYEIDKQRRGVYFLIYFRAPTSSISHIERDCNLSERIMRVMILSAEHLTDEEISVHDDRESLGTEAKMRAAERAEAEAAEAPAGASAEAPAPTE